MRMRQRTQQEAETLTEGFRTDIYEGSASTTLTASEKAIRHFARASELSFHGKRGVPPGTTFGPMSEANKEKKRQTMLRKRDELVRRAAS